MVQLGLKFLAILGLCLLPFATLGQVTAIPCNQLPALFGDPNAANCGQAGSWTPSLVGSTGAGTFTYSVQVGSYERIGRSIIARFGLAITATSVSPTGIMQIGGLPFTSNGITNDDGQCTVTDWTGVTLDTNYVLLGGLIIQNVTTVLLIENGSGQAGQTISILRFSPTTTAIFGFCLYHI